MLRKIKQYLIEAWLSAHIAVSIYIHCCVSSYLSSLLRVSKNFRWQTCTVADELFMDGRTNLPIVSASQPPRKAPIIPPGINRAVVRDHVSVIEDSEKLP